MAFWSKPAMQKAIDLKLFASLLPLFWKLGRLPELPPRPCRGGSDSLQGVYASNWDCKAPEL
jgi:hypothetical protein